ncbi:hypothetical protein BGM26_05065 [Bacillus sp. FJAT-29790]|uniref:hypothetical protein n=1 Tax=Bacillus sp. FJAT-29790 TaxID=1895002 RepID=UPI001C216D30|nr:hypothetical protein [Bacillus sp. FJAT-29790]MBU8878358.1 hypothetical protein [Bacillus sp. FJAT-29790]
MIFILVFFFVIIAIIMIKKRKKRKFRLKDERVPTNLGFRIEGGKQLSKCLRSSLPSTFVNNLKRRLLENEPSWKNHDFDWRFFELKRYFVLNSLLKTVPMFSEKVDEVWHEMLMFTKDYEKFSNKFYQEFLHHTPNMDSTPIPGERAFFDWVYLSLFQSTVNSRLLWKGFLKYPIKKEILGDFKNLSEKELLVKYFRQTEDCYDVKKYLIQKMKTEIVQSETIEYKNQPTSFNKLTSENEYHTLLPAFVFFSIYEADLFQQNMNSLFPAYTGKSDKGGGSSSCSGYGCSSSSDNDSGGSSSCSSSSSCGGGCS